MPVGLITAPALFQRTMNNVFGDLRFDFTLAYIDDLIIYYFYFSQHLQHLDAVLSRIDKFNLHAGLSKCSFAHDSDTLWIATAFALILVMCRRFSIGNLPEMCKKWNLSPIWLVTIVIWFPTLRYWFSLPAWWGSGSCSRHVLPCQPWYGKGCLEITHDGIWLNTIMVTLLVGKHDEAIYDFNYFTGDRAYADFPPDSTFHLPSNVPASYYPEYAVPVDYDDQLIYSEIPTNRLSPVAWVESYSWLAGA